MANGIRTHDLRNHNPDGHKSNTLTGQQFTSTVANGCTNGCTNSPEIAHSGQPEAVSLAELQRLDTLPDPDELARSRWLEFLDAEPDLLTVVESWHKLPELVRAGVVAMVRAAGGGA